MDFVKELQDLRYLEWADVKMSPGMPGSFLKAYEEKNGEMEDRAVQSFIGSKSLEYNLRFVSKEKKVFNGVLKEKDKKKLLGGLECVLPQEHLDKIWEMIWGRWESYVQVCNQKQDIQ